MKRNRCQIARNMGKRENTSPPREKSNSSSSTSSSVKIMEMSDKEFRAFIMLKLTEMEEKRDNELLKRKEKEVDEFQEMRKFLQDLKEELYTLQKIQTERLEMKSIIQEVKISLESIKSRLDHSENRISDVEEKMAGLEKSTMKAELQEFERNTPSIR